MTESQLTELLAGIGGAMKKYTGDYVAKQLAPLLARIAQLETELAEYRAMGALADKGVWRDGSTYDKGHVVSDKGSMWVALRTTRARPGGPDWRLCVKAGRDAR